MRNAAWVFVMMVGSFAATAQAAPDGLRVVALMPPEAPESEQSPNRLIFLENFFDELQRRVPTGK